ncbi:MAG TPA: heat-inducible transcriptional repressor HrcA [Gemmatimonadaceae bacterium]|nr:heat-inducible transcriptional repressor HrcA [Gemmatimonadaceae bacterium]
MSVPGLSERERRILEAVIQAYVATAQPAGSRSIAHKFGLGVSPATIRNTMSDLEEKGYLYHPHASAGRVPTDVAYRVYVDSLIPIRAPDLNERERLTAQIVAGGSAVEAILRRAAQSLGVITQELGIALGPRLDDALLERVELIKLSSERLLLALTLSAGAVRTIFVDVHGEIADAAISEVTRVLNERLAGLSLRQIRSSLGDRLRDIGPTREASDLLNVFIEEGDQLFDSALESNDDTVLLGQASVLAEQPEFASIDNMRKLVALTETREKLGELLRRRSETGGVSITIGNEHNDPKLANFTVVTASYHAGPLAGVIGVIGPTRMPYDKVISLVTHTSELVTDLLKENPRSHG